MDNELTTDIFICCHKDYNILLHNKVYKNICGIENLNLSSDLETIHETYDGDSLLKLNHGYGEGSRIYWVWKHYPLKQYVGFCHYRCYFSFRDNIPNIDDIFKEHDVILKNRCILPARTSVRDHYKNEHCIKDLETCLEIINSKFPEYNDVIDTVLNRYYFYIKNMFIMKISDFNEYCNFIYGILKEYCNIKHYDNDNDILEDVRNHIEDYARISSKEDEVRISYQARKLGFLMERLSNIFYEKHFKNIYLR